MAIAQSPAMDDKQKAEEAKKSTERETAAQIRLRAQNQVITDEEMQRLKEQGRLDQTRAERTTDLAEGRARGQQIFGDKSLGRISEGFSNEEMSAMRDQNLGTINANNKANLRALRIQQAAQGVRGGQAVAQTAKTRLEQGKQVGDTERDLFLKNIDARRDAQKYNIDQAKAEKQAQLTTELGYGALGSADRGAIIQGIVGEKQAAAAANSGGGKK